MRTIARGLPRSPAVDAALTGIWVRARIILQSAARLPVQEVARRAGVSRAAVWRWQRRFAAPGAEGLLHDKPRVPGKALLPAETVQRVLALTCSAPPGAVTPWTARAMAAAVGSGFSSARRIWQAHGLPPHRIRTFKRSKAPKFAAKVAEVPAAQELPDLLEGVAAAHSLV